MISTMLNAGQPLSTVSKHIGYSSVSITADVYGHRDVGAELKVAEAMQEIVRRRKVPNKCPLLSALLP